ncbi:MAG: hypothetical protein H6669_06975 [Ardenticatenaceae bacterium]|nr:hypothetical protein [Ardenticatenaceae bacterium]
MVSPQAVNEAPARNLGFLNGLLIGLALALGIWGLEAINLLDVPVLLRFPSLVFAALVLVAGFSLTGWLTGRVEKMGVVLLGWLVTAVLASFLIAYQPTLGRTLTVWLADRRFWGLPVYPFTAGSLAAPILAGFFVILVLLFLAVLQNYRLEAVGREVNVNGRLQFRAWLQLLLPLPIIFIAGMVTRDIVSDPSTQAVQTVYHALQRTLAYDGDLYELGLREGLNYSAFNSVRDQLTPDYSMAIGGLEPEMSITYVVIHFANDAWVNCRLISDYLSYCYDAAPPYTIGLASLITGEAPPESCLGCLPRSSTEWQTWLRSKGVNFADPPQIRRLAQWGGYVLMRAESNDYALECWFNGISPVQLDHCEEVENKS